MPFLFPGRQQGDGRFNVIGVHLVKRLGLVIAAAVIITATGSAHHSPAAFDMNSQITIQGTVSRLDWTNPHVYIYVNGESASGKPAEWRIETDPVPILNRSGWRRESLAVGSPVTVRASPDRNPQAESCVALVDRVGIRATRTNYDEEERRNARLCTGVPPVW
jgi:hypothetical protein